METMQAQFFINMLPYYWRRYRIAEEERTGEKVTLEDGAFEAGLGVSKFRTYVTVPAFRFVDSEAIGAISKLFGISADKATHATVVEVPRIEGVEVG